MRFGKKIGNLRTLTVIAAAAFAVGVLVPDVSGQGTRRKRTPAPTPTPVVIIPAVPRGGDAQIVSRASDFPDDGVQLVPIEPKRPELPTFDSTETSRALDDIRNRINNLETMKKDDPDEKQKRLLLNLDILSRAEQRSESLRRQLFELMEKETGIRAKLDIIEVNSRSEAIEREVAFAGTLRPEDLRAMKRKQLEAEKTSLTTILSEIQRTKSLLEQNLLRSDEMVSKLRAKLDREIDAALADDGPKP